MTVAATTAVMWPRKPMKSAGTSSHSQTGSVPRKISAVYQQEVTTLIEAADQLMTKREPAAALREWLMLFVDFLDTKHGMAEAMDTLRRA
jgi:hypothetical protein